LAAGRAHEKSKTGLSVDEPFPVKLQNASLNTMGQDARKSIYAWLTVISMFSFVWVINEFGVTGLIGENLTGWLFSTLGILAVINFVRFCWGLWQRRATNVRNPNL